MSDRRYDWNLAIRQNKNRCNAIEPCASCGIGTLSWEWDLQLFCMATGETVCAECGDTLAPDLAKALRAAHLPYSYRCDGKDAGTKGWPWEESATKVSDTLPKRPEDGRKEW